MREVEPARTAPCEARVQTPLLSVVMPTKDRMRYAVHAIRSILSVNDLELELVVSDNSESDELSRWVSAHVRDARFRYRRVPEQMSMTDNYNAAMNMASGLYVCTLGDDDGVNPNLMAAVRWAKSKGLDALSSRSNSGLVYFWPDFISRTRGAGLAGKLLVEEFTGAVSSIDVGAELRSCVANAGQGSLGLPRVYHGIIRRSCWLEVLSATGTYFKGVSPDVYGAIIVSRYLKNACAIDYPLTIGGNSGGSNSGRAAKGTHKGNLEDDPHIQPYRNLVWPAGVPRFFSVETVWASASIEALSSSDRADLLSSFNYARLHAMCAFRHPDYLRVTLKCYSNLLAAQKRSQISGYLELAWELTIVCLRFGKHVVTRLLPALSMRKRFEYGGLRDIDEAAQTALKHLREGASLDLA